MVPALVGLALDYYRDPLARPHLSEVNRALPKGFDTMLSEFCSALSTVRIDETAAELATDRRTLEEAARFFVRHVLLNAAGDYYRHLGLNRDASAEAIRHHYQLLIRMFHPDRVENSTGLGAEAGAFYATRINLAYQTLGEPGEREAYDGALPEYPFGSAETDPALFFRPTGPALEAGPSRWSDHSNATLRSWPRKMVPLFRALVIGALLIGTLYTLIQVNRKPALRISPDASAERTPPLPSFLAPSRPEPAADFVGTRVRSTDSLQAAKPVSVAVQGAGPAPGKTDLPRTADRLERLAQINEPTVTRPPLAPEPVITSEPTPTPIWEKADPAIVGPADRIGTEPAPAPLPPLRVPIPVTPAPVPSAAPTRPAASERIVASPIEPEAPRNAVEVYRDSDRALSRASKPAPATTNPPAETVRATPRLPATQPLVPERPTAPIEIPPKPVAQPAPIAPPSVSSSAPPNTQRSDTRSPAQAANAVVARLQSAYRARNADGFAALFRKNAQVNEGQGRALIRSIYDDLFQRLSGANLSVTAMQWRVLPNGRMAGSGRILVSNKDQGQSAWRDARGRIDFELISESGEYLISSMRYHLN